LSFSCGIVGLPNVGKTTLFNALCRLQAAVGEYPFTTIERNVGVVPVPDDRLQAVARIVGSARLTPATVKVVDIAGLVEGASRGEGLGNRFLAHVREVDAILHVVRCFTRPDVPHTTGDVDPVRDVELVETELLLADLEVVERRRDKVATLAKAHRTAHREELAALEELRAWLAAGRAARDWPGPCQVLQPLNLITRKPVVYVANVDEWAGQSAGRPEQALRELARARGAGYVPVSARIEAEFAELEHDEEEALRAEMGLGRSQTVALVREAYRILNLVTFFTANRNEATAWSVPVGTPVVRAAGKVHSDMERGFIRAEVVRAEDLIRAGSLQAARQQGLVRIEGREYQVQDGDVIYFRFAA